MGSKQKYGGGGGVVGRDIIEQIMMRLPPKSIGRLRCVCKEWLEISSDPKFISKYSKVQGCYILWNQSGLELLTINKPACSSSITRFSLACMDKYREGGVKVLHFCSGLILCQGLANPFLLSVYNPTTKEHVVVPCPQHSWSSYTYNLAFDPSVSPLHFKVYAMTMPYPKRAVYTNRQQRVYRYSSLERWRSWEKIYHGSYLLSTRVGAHSLYWKGKLCWENRSGVTNDEKFLLLNDVTKNGILEEFSRMPRPPIQYQGKRINVIRRVTVEARSGRLICITEASSRTSKVPYAVPSFEYSIYGMDDVSLGWSLMHRVDLNTFLPLLYPNTEVVHDLIEYQVPRKFNGIYNMTVMSFVNSILDDDGKDDMLLLHLPTKIVAYNLRRGTFSPVWTDHPLFGKHKPPTLFIGPLRQPHANLLCSLPQLNCHGGKSDTAISSS